MKLVSSHPAADVDHVIADDSRSVESLDSLESEQPSYRSHMINASASQSNNNQSNNNNHHASEHSPGGGGTYRQESPTVLMNNLKPTASSGTHRKPTKQLTSPAATDVNSFAGFQVVDTHEHSRLSRVGGTQHVNERCNEPVVLSNTQPTERNHGISSGIQQPPNPDTGDHSNAENGMYCTPTCFFR